MPRRASPRWPWLLACRFSRPLQRLCAHAAGSDQTAATADCLFSIIPAAEPDAFGRAFALKDPLGVGALALPIVDVDMSTIKDWDTFHDTFATTLGFPDFYGRNMNAWIACLTYEDDGMSAFPVASGEVLTLRLQDCKEFRLRCPEIYEGLIDAAAFVNWRRIDVGDMSILTLAFR